MASTTNRPTTPATNAPPRAPTSGPAPDAAGVAPGAADPGSPLAPDASSGPDGPDAPRLLLFRVGGRTMGCPLEVAREVLVADVATRLPGAPGHVLGLQNVRGRVLTVLDVGRALDAAAPAPAGGQLIVVEAGDGRRAGCRVDAVLRVVPAPPVTPAAPGEAVGNVRGTGIVLGAGQVEGEPVTVLDLPRCVRETLVDRGER